VPDAHHLEQPSRFDLGSVLRQLPGTRPDAATRVGLADLLVDLLDLVKERIPAFRNTWAAFQNARWPPGRRVCQALT